MTESEPDNPLPQSAHDPAAPPAEAAGAEGAAAAKPSIKEQLATARTEAAANYDRYLRAVADLENYRRRVVREKEEQRQFAVVNLVQDLLPVLDNLQFGLTAARPQGDAKTIADGVAMPASGSTPIGTSRCPTSRAPRCPKSTCSRWCGRVTPCMAGCCGPPA
jgi:molecular chaperone GrpE